MESTSLLLELAERRRQAMLAADLPALRQLMVDATREDVDFKATRRLDKVIYMDLVDTRRVSAQRNILITGP